MAIKLIEIVARQCMETGCPGRADYEVHDGESYMGSYCSNHAHDKRDALDAYHARIDRMGRCGKCGEPIRHDPLTGTTCACAVSRRDNG